MQDHLIDGLLKERAELSQKLAAIDVVLAAYGALPQPAVFGASRVTPVIPVATGSKPSSPRLKTDRDGKPLESFTPYGRNVIAGCVLLMMGETVPKKTRDLVSGLELMGVEIRGENKINALGALLGRSADIVSHGKMGWTLANPDAAEQIVGQYFHVENEPPSVSAGGSDAVGEGVAAPNPTQDQLRWGQGT